MNHRTAKMIRLTATVTRAPSRAYRKAKMAWNEIPRPERHKAREQYMARLEQLADATRSRLSASAER